MVELFIKFKEVRVFMWFLAMCLFLCSAGYFLAAIKWW